MNSNHNILADNRWTGTHGIGRFSHEILSRLQNTQWLTQGPSPLSFKNVYWLPQQLSSHKNQCRVFFSPGFMPPLYSPIPFVFTIHDLIHLHGPSEGQLKNKMIYNTLIKYAAHRAAKIITVSDYSKQEIMAWANLSSDKIAVIYNGISSIFTPQGNKHQPGYSYFLYVGNTKPHKNVPRLMQAFADAKIDTAIKLVLTTQLTPELQTLIQKHRLAERIVIQSHLSENQLADYYRGAMGLLFPSLYEGFGLPVVEAMASGTPVITSNVTSLPEVAGNAAIMINPLDTASLTFNIEQMVSNDALRQALIAKGLNRAAEFSWDRAASQLQQILSAI